MLDCDHMTSDLVYCLAAFCIASAVLSAIKAAFVLIFFLWVAFGQTGGLNRRVKQEALAVQAWVHSMPTAYAYYQVKWIIRWSLCNRRPAYRDC